MQPSEVGEDCEYRGENERRLRVLMDVTRCEEGCIPSQYSSPIAMHPFCIPFQFQPTSLAALEAADDEEACLAKDDWTSCLLKRGAADERAPAPSLPSMVRWMDG